MVCSRKQWEEQRLGISSKEGGRRNLREWAVVECKEDRYHNISKYLQEVDSIEMGEVCNVARYR